MVRKIPAKINIAEEIKQAHRQLRVAAYCRVSTAQEEQLNSYDVQSADVLGTLKLHIGMGLDTSDTEDNILDIQIRIAEIDAEFKAMLQAIATDTVEDFDEQRATDRKSVV